MTSRELLSSIKTLGSKGQVSLGKQYAGRQVIIEEREPGVWLVRTAKVIPDNEYWLNDSNATTDLNTAMTWANSHSASDKNTEILLKQLEQQDE